MKRDFTMYLPDNATENMPVVISLHGGFASPKGQFRLANFRPVADRERFIVVCPASKHGWQDGKNVKRIDDVKFIDELITYLVYNYHVNANRIYVTGISKGGFMAARLACQLGNKIAAVAIVAATLNTNEGYAPQYPMPIMFIHGTKDPIVPYKGGNLFGRSIYSHPDIIKKWVLLDNCNPKPVITTMPDTAKDGTSIVKEEYTNAVTGMQVIGYTVNNGGHTWPGGWQYLPGFIIGKTSKNLNACEAIWAFFKLYQLGN
ncbi:alpha/beta hydrolase family esterase [Mucilaginibacter gracilis]|uniref:alpha/beta hydrolase family esterase n=1 Tax=Mucilaginibacter gracilis TaxID=423350 RepID=UPI0021D10E8A|nr:PHB depolymerase family esterase [Mucilaginibacter gracilis]